MVRFFFVKQKTAYEMRISDWSSDVCSSDLVIATRARVEAAQVKARRPTKVIEPSPRKSSASAFSAWLLARKPPTISARPKPTFSRTEEHTSELQSLMRISYAVFCLKKKRHTK